MPTLHWLTRREDEQTAGKAPYRLLEPVAELPYRSVYEQLRAETIQR
jgi:hypothetical protein